MNPKTIQILLIEDNPGDIDLTREGIKDWRILNNLSVVRDGVEAMRYLHREAPYADAPRPDLILLDLNLPKKDGREVLHEIKTDKFLRIIPVVILSSSNADMDILKTYGMGANCYVVKPIGLETFFKVLNSIGDFWFNIVSLPSKEMLKQVRKNTATEISSLERLEKSKTKINVLIIDDNPADSFFVEQSLLEKQYPFFHVESAVTLKAGIERLSRGEIDVVLLDLGLPDSQGLETYEKLNEEFPSLPVVISTGLDDNKTAVKAIRLGAQDYIIKNQIEGQLLSRVLQYAIERKWIDEQQTILIAREQAARAEAENATLARDEFLSIASHELKTPVTALQLQSQILLQLLNEGAEEKIWQKNKRLVQIFHNQIERLGKLIDNLLDISRINAGRLVLEFALVDLKEIVTDVLERFHDQINASGCKVTFSGESAVGNWDRFRIEQVVTNLLTNAMKYGAGKPVEISIKKTDKYVEFEIRDHGIGIKEENLAKLFSRFERFVRPSEYSGMGLGLYIVRQIIDAHQGQVKVKSLFGQGSTFTVTLPVAQAEQKVMPTPPREGDLHAF